MLWLCVANDVYVLRRFVFRFVVWVVAYVLLVCSVFVVCLFDCCAAGLVCLLVVAHCFC